ncbi:MAG TPA: hypothetical protein VIN09_01820 [Chloroflexota bacterium]
MRNRLHDPFLFGMALATTGFLTFCLAVTWLLFGGALLLALTVLSVVPAFVLFYLRDRSGG